MVISIGTDGTLRTLYTEDIDLEAFGPMTIRRASNVEPGPGGWFADLAPVAGPTLGPFDLRSEALRAEARWIEDNHLTRPA